jgi:hypothetical protein
MAYTRNRKSARRTSSRNTGARRSGGGRSSTKQRRGNTSRRSGANTVRVVIEQVAPSASVIGTNGVLQTASNDKRKSQF